MISTFQRGQQLVRRLLNGREVAERPAPAQIVLSTRCPQKWAFVDLEEGVVWEHDGVAFRLRPFLSEQQRQAFVKAVGTFSNQSHNG